MKYVRKNSANAIKRNLRSVPFTNKEKPEQLRNEYRYVLSRAKIVALSTRASLDRHIFVNFRFFLHITRCDVLHCMTVVALLLQHFCCDTASIKDHLSTTKY